MTQQTRESITLAMVKPGRYRVVEYPGIEIRLMPRRAPKNGPVKPRGWVPVVVDGGPEIGVREATRKHAVDSLREYLDAKRKAEAHGEPAPPPGPVGVGMVGWRQLDAALAQITRAAHEIADQAARAAVSSADDESASEIVDRVIRRAQYEALRAMLDVLDGWIEGARENHEAMGRREPFDDRFAPEDIRAMVNDAARQVGAREPWQRPAAS